MKLKSIVKSKCGIDAIALVTEPQMSKEIFAELEKLHEKSPVIGKCRLGAENGLLYVRSKLAGQPLEITDEFKTVLWQALDFAEAAVIRAQEEKEVQEQQKQAQKTQTIENASKALGVPVIEREEASERRLDL